MRALVATAILLKPTWLPRFTRLQLTLPPLLGFFQRLLARLSSGLVDGRLPSHNTSLPRPPADKEEEEEEEEEQEATAQEFGTRQLLPGLVKDSVKQSVEARTRNHPVSKPQQLIPSASTSLYSFL